MSVLFTYFVLKELFASVMFSPIGMFFSTLIDVTWIPDCIIRRFDYSSFVFCFSLFFHWRSVDIMTIVDKYLYVIILFRSSIRIKTERKTKRLIEYSSIRLLWKKFARKGLHAAYTWVKITQLKYVLYSYIIIFIQYMISLEVFILKLFYEILFLFFHPISNEATRSFCKNLCIW